MINTAKLVADCKKLLRLKKDACIIVPVRTILINKNGTAKKSPSCPNCGSWINHWHRLSGQQVPSAGCCAIKGCTGRTEEGKIADIEGCHVTITGCKDQHVFIVPICQCCNHKADGAELVLSKQMTLVWSNVQETCGKLKANI